MQVALKIWRFDSSTGERALRDYEIDAPDEATLLDCLDIVKDKVDGVDTTHYRGRLAAQTAGGTAGPFDVWVGKDDGYVRRVQFATGAAASTASARLTMDLSDFGKDVTITVPSAAETADATTLNIPGLGG